MPAVGLAPRFDILGNVEEPELELRILGFLGPTARELLLELALVSRRWQSAVMQDALWEARCPAGTLKLSTHSWFQVSKEMHILRRHDAEAASALARKEQHALTRPRVYSPTSGDERISPMSPNCGGDSPTYSPTSPTYSPASPNCGGDSPRYSPRAPGSPSWEDSPSFPPTACPRSEDSEAAVGGFPEDIARTSGDLVEGLEVDNDALVQDAAVLLQLSQEVHEQLQGLGGQREMTAYLGRALGRYERFMSLKAAHPSTLLVPTRDIEAIWISHLIRPVQTRFQSPALCSRPLLTPLANAQ